jgi:hypothetical protein
VTLPLDGLMRTPNHMSEARRLQLKGTIDRGPGQTSLDCRLLEISHDSARIEIENPHFVPKGFELVLSENAKVRRYCTVIDRGPNWIDVAIFKEKP